MTLTSPIVQPPAAGPSGNSGNFLTHSRHSDAPKGETLVWFTSLGLAGGLLMITALLGVVIVNGLDVFWPKRIVEVTLSGDSPHRLKNAPLLLGEVRKIRQKKYSEASPSGDNNPVMEWQLFIGNKDRWGAGFHYLDESDIVKKDYPRDVLWIERLEYGFAIGRPLELVEEEGRRIPVAHHAFSSEFKSWLDESVERRERIYEIEKIRIGRVNALMEALRIEKKRLTHEGTDEPGYADQIKTWEARAHLLEAEYEVLAAEARKLRAEDEGRFLILRLATGEETRIRFSQIIRFLYPNALTGAQRLGVFGQNLARFFKDNPREANTEGGIFPAIFGTFVMTVLMSVAVTPFGILAAIYLREYAKQGIFVRTVRIAVNNLAGVPSIVFGVFGLGFFIYGLGGLIDRIFFPYALPTPTFGTGGLLWCSLTLALMTVPVVIVATEEALASVPRGVREGSLACGASKWQTIQRVVMPAAAPGIMTGFILAMARGAGEVAPLMLVGVVKLAPTLPVDGIFPFIHFERKFMHLGFHIYDLGFQSPDSEAAKPMVFATTLVLIALVITLNLTAIIIRNRLRRRYAISAF